MTLQNNIIIDCQKGYFYLLEDYEALKPLMNHTLTFFLLLCLRASFAFCIGKNLQGMPSISFRAARNLFLELPFGPPDPISIQYHRFFRCPISIFPDIDADIEKTR